MPLVARPQLDRATASSIVDAIASVPWGELQHAYGGAEDVRNQLIAIVIGDDATRAVAWWNLWGNIHHQGTIYSATVEAVPLVARLASWTRFPDRVEALTFLRAVAAAAGVVVWTYDRDGEIVYDEVAQDALTAQLAVNVARALPMVFESWRRQPAEIQRALLWLLSPLPQFDARYEALIREVLPDRFGTAWALVRSGPESEQDADAIFAFEEWALSSCEAE